MRIRNPDPDFDKKVEEIIKKKLRAGPKGMPDLYKEVKESIKNHVAEVLCRQLVWNLIDEGTVKLRPDGMFELIRKKKVH